MTPESQNEADHPDPGSLTTDLGESVFRRGALPFPALLLGALIGSTLAFGLHVLFTGVPGSEALPLVVAESIELAPLPATRLPPRAQNVAPITPESTLEARQELAAARRALQKLDAHAAVVALEECIRLADLDGCHLELGLVLLVAGDGAVYPHIERYLELSPAPVEADVLRAVLERVGTSTTS